MHCLQITRHYTNAKLIRAEPVTTARSAPGAEREHTSRVLHTATVLLQTEWQQPTTTEQHQPWQGHRTV